MVAIVVGVGSTRSWRAARVVGAAAAVVVLAAVGAATYRLVARIPRRALQLFVGALLSAFGTFWSAEGLGVRWPGGELSLVWLVALYAASGIVLVRLVGGWQ